MDDDKIVALYWERNETAIEATAAKYDSYCHKIAYYILTNQEDSDEAVNDTYLCAWKSIPPHRPTLLSTYLGKLTRRISLKIWRSRTAQKRGGGELTLALDELMDCIPNQDSIEEGLETQELTELVNQFLGALKTDERRVFLQRYWYLMPIAEICKTSGYSKSKVESMLFRTRKKLQKRLQKEEIL